MKPLPVAIVHRMIYNKKPVESRKLKYQEKSYKFSVYEMTKADFAKVQRVDGQATMFLGPIKDGNETVELNATSISMADLKAAIATYPLVGVMAIARGKTEDGDIKYAAVTSIAFDKIENFDKAKIEALKTAVQTKEKRDSQQTKLYRWEGENMNVLTGKITRGNAEFKKASPTKLKALALKVLEHFKIPTSKIHISTEATKVKRRLGLTQTYRDDANSDKPVFNIVHVHDASIDTLLHELAHVVVSYRYSKGLVASHGAEFCGVYANILGLFTSVKEDMVIDSMKKFGLKVEKYTQPTTKVSMD